MIDHARVRDEWEGERRAVHVIDYLHPWSIVTPCVVVSDFETKLVIQGVHANELEDH